MKKIFQKILSIVTAFTMLLCASSSSIQIFTNEIETHAANTKIIYGDVNGDKKVNVFDLSLIKKEILNPGTSIDLIAADVNGDGIIDSKDAREVQQFLLCRNYSFSATIRNDLESIDCTIVTKDQPIETSLTAEMAEKTKELGSAVAVYNYLYNNMQSQFYYGSRKGAIGTFEQGGGNDTDLSSLLIAMLRYLGYEANYVTTVAGFTESELLSWTNTDSIDVAIAIYAAQGRSHDIYTSGNTKYYCCDYKYVQLIDNGKTYYLDVCFKNYENQKTVYDAIDSSYSISSNAKTILDNTDIDLLSKEIFKSQSAVSKLENNSYALNSRKVMQKSIKSLPTGNPHSYDGELTISENLSDGESDLVLIGFDDNSLKMYRATQLYSKNITISYEVSSTTKEVAALKEDPTIGWLYDQINIDTSSIFNLPCIEEVTKTNLSVTPVIKIDGIKEFTGPILNIGEKQTLYIATNTGGEIKTYEESLTAGEMCSIVFDMGQISANELRNTYTATLKKTETINQKNKFTSNMSDSNLNENNVYSSDYLGNLLRLTGVMYFAQMDISTQAIAERNDIYYENTLRFGVFGFKPDVYVPGSIQVQGNKDGIQKQGQYFVDILSNAVTNISKTNNVSKLETFNFVRGLLSSELESAVLEEILNVEGISTASIFRHSQENGIPLITLSATSNKKISDLNIDSEDATRIQEEINNGNIVITTQSNVTIGNWNGIGYIVMTSDGSAQWYKISGGYSGGITVDPIGLYYTINVALDLSMIAESISALVGILTMMSSLALLPVALVALSLISIELLTFDILEQSFLYYEYEFKNNVESGVEIWISTATTSVITITTMAIGKGISKLADIVISSNLSRTYGKTIISNVIEKSGLEIKQINSKIKMFKKIGMRKSTIDILLQGIDGKGLFLEEKFLKIIVDSGKDAEIVAKIFMDNSESFVQKLIDTNTLVTFCELAKTSNELVHTLYILSEQCPENADALIQLSAEYKTPFINEAKIYFNKNNKIGINIFINRFESTSLIKLEDYADTSFKNNIKIYFDKLPDWAKKSGNFAYAEANIDGFSKINYFAHSAIHTEIPSVKNTGISVSPTATIFKTYNVNNNNVIDGVNAYSRDVDTENKILSEIASNIKDDSVNGKILFYTYKKPCVSCDNVFSTFAKKYKNIEIIILYEEPY